MVGKAVNAICTISVAVNEICTIRLEHKENNSLDKDLALNRILQSTPLIVTLLSVHSRLQSHRTVQLSSV